mgnify:CR=1 FL=1
MDGHRTRTPPDQIPSNLPGCHELTVGPDSDGAP